VGEFGFHHAGQNDHHVHAVIFQTRPFRYSKDGKLRAAVSRARRTHVIAADGRDADDLPELAGGLQHLLDLGHKQIACIGGPPRWTASTGSLVEGDWSAERGFRAAAQLLERTSRKFTAIVAPNDHI
jgi:DNA-binding LacI/PurR family transcriptional regulator